MTVLTSSSSTTNETALQKEQHLFGELSVRLRDALINRVFDLRPKAATSRMQYLIFLFLLSGFLVSLRSYPMILWAGHLQDIFYYLLNPAYAASYVGNPFSKFFSFLVQAFTDPRTLQYLPIFLAPFFIALQTAAMYLANIFELDDVTIARKFIIEVALSGSDETIRITQGDILNEHRTSPNYLIGGPGKVIVDIDSVALFEKPDGTTRVIGPTGKEPSGKATIGGFERFRQAVDLRDHFIELREEVGKAAVVKGRSLDGIPITATDVRFMFSVYRDGKKPTIEDPYPFSAKSIEQLIFKATSKVTPDLTNPSTFEFSWIHNMVNLIRGRLGGFMNERRLTEYLASIGMPEYERAKQQEDSITEQVQKLAPSTAEDLPKGRDIQPPPKFMSRYEIKNLFGQFTEEFTKSARDRGVELHWIGLGTWKVPTEIVPETKVVPEHHLEAWKISRENLFKGNKESFDGFKNESTIQEMITLIQDVPVAAYQDATEKYDHNNTIRALLAAYRQQLIEAAEFLRAKGKPVPVGIINAIEHINKILGFKDWHWVGTVQPDSGGPSSGSSSASKPETETPRSVESAYQELVQLVGGDPATADRLIELERRQYPYESRARLIERAIERLLHDRK